MVSLTSGSLGYTKGPSFKLAKILHLETSMYKSSIAMLDTVKLDTVKIVGKIYFILLEEMF